MDISINFINQYVIAAAILVGGFIAIKIILAVIGKALKKTSLDEALHRFILSASKAILWLVLLVTFLGYLNVPVAPLLTVLGAAGAAAALALKDCLANIAGGIIILITKPFGRGDFIEVSGTSGEVDHIELLFTTLRTEDNKTVRVPNGVISTSVLVNHRTKTSPAGAEAGEAS